MAIAIRNLSLNYHKTKIFDNFSLEIEENKITCIMGPNGSGKSTLIKVILGLIPYQGYIRMGNTILTKENIKDMRRQIGVVFENPDNQFVSETVMDEIAFTLENLNYNKKKIKSKIEEVSRYLGIYDILSVNPHSLSAEKKQLVALASAIVHEPSLLLLDDSFNMISDKDKIFSYLKENKTTVIYITHDIEDSLYADNIVLLNKGKLVLNDKKENVYEQEKTLQSLGFDLPFMVSLSNRLKFYDLIDKTIYDMEEMVDSLWK